MSEKQSLASRERQMKYTPEERKQRMAMLASKKWTMMSKEDRVGHITKMVNAKKNKIIN